MAFNAEGRECALLKSTRPMDAWEGYPEEPDDSAKKKDTDKILRYEHHRAFLGEYSKRKLGKLKWSC